MYHYFQILECARIYPTSVIKIRKLTIKAIDGSFLFCSNDALYITKGSSSVLHVTFSCLVSLIPFSLE